MAYVFSKPPCDCLLIPGQRQDAPQADFIHAAGPEPMCRPARREQNFLGSSRHFVSMPRTENGELENLRESWFLAIHGRLDVQALLRPGERVPGPACDLPDYGSGSRRGVPFGEFVVLHHRPISRRQERRIRYLLPGGLALSGVFNDLIEQADEFRRPQGRRTKTRQSVAKRGKPPTPILDRMYVENACARSYKRFCQQRHGVIPRRDRAEDQFEEPVLHQVLSPRVGICKCASATGPIQLPCDRGKAPRPFYNQQDVQLFPVHSYRPSPSRRLQLGYLGCSGFCGLLVPESEPAGNPSCSTKPSARLPLSGL